jgi:hypothetical protein
MAEVVNGSLKEIYEEFGKTTKKTEEFVEYEAFMDNVKSKRKNEIMNEYEDLILWLKTFYKYPVYKGSSEDIWKQFKSAY